MKAYLFILPILLPFLLNISGCAKDDESEKKVANLVLKIDVIRALPTTTSFELRLTNKYSKSFRISKFSLLLLLQRVVLQSENSTWEINPPDGPASPEGTIEDYSIVLDPEKEHILRATLFSGSRVNMGKSMPPNPVNFTFKWKIETANETFDLTDAIEVAGKGRCKFESITYGEVELLR